MKHTNFGKYIQEERERNHFSLRDVEKRTGISNAYLSQLESNKIKQPSPKILFKLGELYGLSYSLLLSLVGYPVPEKETTNIQSRLGDITPEEEDSLLEYLEFLRSKKK